MERTPGMNPGLAAPDTTRSDNNHQVRSCAGGRHGELCPGLILRTLQRPQSWRRRGPPGAGCHPDATQSLVLDPLPLSTPGSAALEPSQPQSGDPGAQRHLEGLGDERIRKMDPPLQGPLCSSLPCPCGPPTLNPDPEALLNFACGALRQAGVQPSIVHLESEQGDQLPLAPCGHPSCHP